MTRIASILPTLGGRLRDWVAPRYRPEKHYMRGPGPKWYALHSHARPHNHK